MYTRPVASPTRNELLKRFFPGKSFDDIPAVKWNVHGHVMASVMVKHFGELSNPRAKIQQWRTEVPDFTVADSEADRDKIGIAMYLDARGDLVLTEFGMCLALALLVSANDARLALLTPLVPPLIIQTVEPTKTKKRPLSLPTEAPPPSKKQRVEKPVKPAATAPKRTFPTFAAMMEMLAKSKATGFVHE